MSHRQRFVRGGELSHETFVILEKSQYSSDNFFLCFIFIYLPQIDMSEMFSYFRLEDNILHRKLFSYFDEDGSGYLNFAEFTCTLWNFLTSKSLGLIFFNMVRQFTLSHTHTHTVVRAVYNLNLTC